MYSVLRWISTSQKDGKRKTVNSTRMRSSNLILSSTVCFPCCLLFSKIENKSFFFHLLFVDFEFNQSGLPNYIILSPFKMASEEIGNELLQRLLNESNIAHRFNIYGSQIYQQGGQEEEVEAPQDMSSSQIITQVYDDEQSSTEYSATESNSYRTFLIEEVKKFPCVWDTRVRSFKNGEMKKQAWIKIGKAV